MANPTSKIIINGKEVGPEKIPEMLRQFVTDANQDGIPDFMEGLFKNPIFKMITGKSMENLTPEQQVKISTLLEKLGGGGAAADSASVITTGSASPGFRPPSSPPALDYKALGIEDPDQKHAPSLGWMVVAAILGVIAVAVWMLMKG